jgi:membrane protein implicated in regulation of membrane protease activity
MSFTSFLKTLFSAEPESISKGFSAPSLPSASYPNLVNRAVVTIPIQPGKAGQVKFQGSWWTAWSTQETTLVSGQTVLVTGSQNISLYVEPI